jgi:carbon storage regulator
MLVLTRRVGEAFVIGDNVVVTICAINGNSVRIGVTAPRDVDVHREEVYARIQQGVAPVTPMVRARAPAAGTAEGGCTAENSRFKTGKSPI